MNFSRRDFIKIIGAFSIFGITGCSIGEINAINSKNLQFDENFFLSFEPVDYDYLLEDGTIIDGTGKKPYVGRLAIKNGKIVGIGNFIAGKGGKVINAKGLIVTPGFIDLHTHTENYLLHNGKAEMMLYQGVTTHIGGNCGTFQGSIKNYFGKLNETGINIGLFVGLKNLRLNIVGSKKNLVKSELEEIKKLVRKAMKEGAFGLSVGLQYWPQIYTTTEELIEICKVVSEYGGFYSTHVRNEENSVIPSVEEAIKIGFEAGVPVEYSHIKTAQKPNWGKMPKVLNLLDEAHAKGLDITSDVYGYDFSSLDIGSGRSSISENDMITAMKHPLVMIGSDSGLRINGNATHPRAYGNHPRVIGKYVRDKGVIPLEDCIKKMTFMPAKRLGLNDRGILKIGNAADVTVFDYNSIIDKAERYNPNQYSKGIKHVFVNGRQALKNGEVTGVLAGEKLKHIRV